MQTNPLALFGDHLARLRKARGWSQEKLALESGLARSYVSGIERGRRNVALVNICVLADTLGVPTSEMLRFAQASATTQDAAATSERTPLPQISRSLCKLENRDQIWLAEIIRSLSSRLSHASPAPDIGAHSAIAQPAVGPAGASLQNDHRAGIRTSAEDARGIRAAEMTGEVGETEAVEVPDVADVPDVPDVAETDMAVDNPERPEYPSPETRRPIPGHDVRCAAVDPGFDARSPVTPQFAASGTAPKAPGAHEDSRHFPISDDE